MRKSLVSNSENLFFLNYCDDNIFVGFQPNSCVILSQIDFGKFVTDTCYHRY